ncbi:hypothetical protein NDU88_008287 [Pleurodeles waltl]|uniref:Uncharacterized protein n=1 Tax=Pleurodeles waltl TaxID=8319 RepID=A0AAV7U3Z7_PLEWA|nr:hypothetical protein NDU88_008287 [Pleurodeles waltl]
MKPPSAPVLRAPCLACFWKMRRKAQSSLKSDLENRAEILVYRLLIEVQTITRLQDRRQQWTVVESHHLDCTLTIA